MEFIRVGFSVDDEHFEKMRSVTSDTSWQENSGMSSATDAAEANETSEQGTENTGVRPYLPEGGTHAVNIHFDNTDREVSKKTKHKQQFIDTVNGYLKSNESDPTYKDRVIDALNDPKGTLRTIYGMNPIDRAMTDQQIIDVANRAKYFQSLYGYGESLVDILGLTRTGAKAKPKKMPEKDRVYAGADTLEKNIAMAHQGYGNSGWMIPGNDRKVTFNSYAKAVDDVIKYCKQSDIDYLSGGQQVRIGGKNVGRFNDIVANYVMNDLIKRYKFAEDDITETINQNLLIPGTEKKTDRLLSVNDLMKGISLKRLDKKKARIASEEDSWNMIADRLAFNYKANLGKYYSEDGKEPEGNGGYFYYRDRSDGTKAIFYEVRGKGSSAKQASRALHNLKKDMKDALDEYDKEGLKSDLAKYVRMAKRRGILKKSITLKDYVEQMRKDQVKIDRLYNDTHNEYDKYISPGNKGEPKNSRYLSNKALKNKPVEFADKKNKEAERKLKKESQKTPEELAKEQEEKDAKEQAETKARTDKFNSIMEAGFSSFGVDGGNEEAASLYGYPQYFLKFIKNKLIDRLTSKGSNIFLDKGLFDDLVEKKESIVLGNILKTRLRDMDGVQIGDVPANSDVTVRPVYDNNNNMALAIPVLKQKDGHKSDIVQDGDKEFTITFPELAKIMNEYENEIKKDPLIHPHFFIYVYAKLMASYYDEGDETGKIVIPYYGKEHIERKQASVSWINAPFYVSDAYFTT